MAFVDDPIWLDSKSLSGAEMRRGEAMNYAANGIASGSVGGVRPGDPGLKVSNTGMAWSVAAGVAAVAFAGQGVYRACSTSTVTGPISTAHASLQRLDLVYLRVWDNAVDASGLFQADIVYLAGTAGSGTLPTPSGTIIYIPLAQITVPAGSTTPSATDLRPAAVAPGGIAPVASAALSTAGLYVGHARYNLVRGMIETWDGAAWLAQGDWKNYNPVWTATTTNPVPHSGTLTGRYCLVGKQCTVKIELATASDTTFGSGLYSWALPFTSSADGTGTSEGAGQGITPGVRWDLHGLVTSTQSVLAVFAPNGQNDCRMFQLGSAQGIGGVLPWATQMTIRVQLTYEIA